MAIDANAVSELVRPVPEPEVVAWFSRRDSADLYLIASPPRSTPRCGRTSQGVLAFDRAAEARATAALRRSMGRPILEAGCRIAAITCARGAAVATRNAADIAHCGIAVIDPWTDDGASP